VDEVQLAEAQVKSLVEPKGKRQKKNSRLPGISLKKHQAIPPLDDVSVYLCCIFSAQYTFLTCVLSLFQPIMKKFLAVDTECLEFRADADEAKSKQPDVIFLLIILIVA
jgi:hypothetical protein